MCVCVCFFSREIFPLQQPPVEKVYIHIRATLDSIFLVQTILDVKSELKKKKRKKKGGGCRGGLTHRATGTKGTAAEVMKHRLVN